MSRLINNLDGGKTDELGHVHVLKRIFTGDVVTGLVPTQSGTPGMSVKVSAGAGLLSASSNKKYEIWLDADQDVSVDAANPSNPRKDVLVAYLDPLVAVQSATPNNPANWNLKVVAGVPAAVPTEPDNTAIVASIGSTPYFIIAGVDVLAAATSITNARITDRRSMVSSIVEGPENTNKGWSSLPFTPDTVTPLGNRSYQLTFSNKDYRSYFWEGERLKFERTATPPSQCTSLNGTTQYWSKSSPNKMTWTDDFAVGRWIFLTSYQNATIDSRYNGSSGWQLALDANGRVLLSGYNGSGSNFSEVKSYQSIPLNKWVWVGAQLDMSAFTATTTTSYVMIDGVDVPAVVARGGTNPTALAQAGDYQVGALNGTNFFPGKLGSGGIYSSKVTQATLAATMHQVLTGSETNLASAQSFNGVASDLNTTTPNNLSAVSSAGYTSDSPFAGGSRSYDSNGKTEHALVMGKPSYSTDTTVVVQVPEGHALPVSGGISACWSSKSKAPYGFPTDKSRWCVETIGKITVTQSSPTAQQWYWSSTGAMKVNMPTGSWDVEMQGCVYGEGASASFLDPEVTLNTNNTSSTSNTGNIPDLTSRVVTVVDTVIVCAYMLRTNITVSIPTDHYRKIRMVNAGRSLVGNYVTTAAGDHLRLTPASL